jgi:hypothetical protein
MALLVCTLDGCGHPVIRHDEQGRCWAAGCINKNHFPCSHTMVANNQPDRFTFATDETEAISDPVHHPSHYRAYYPGGPECIDVTGAMGFNVGNAVKYLWRAGRKTPDAIEDLRKALVYVQFEIDRLNREKDA